MQKWDDLKNHQVVDVLGRMCKIGRKSAESVVAITSNRFYTPLPGVNITVTFNQYLLNYNVCL